MKILTQEIVDKLLLLDKYRDEARSLRDQAIHGLEDVTGHLCHKTGDFTHKQWIRSNSVVELATVIKIFNNSALLPDRQPSESFTENYKELKRLFLEEINLKNLFPQSKILIKEKFIEEKRKEGEEILEILRIKGVEISNLKKFQNDLFDEIELEFRNKKETPTNLQETLPVLLAARSLQALTSDPETIFSVQAMLCYYRVVRELNTASIPGSKFGAARASSGVEPSAFITAECVKALAGFSGSLFQTALFFERTAEFLETLWKLKRMDELALDLEGWIRPTKKAAFRNWRTLCLNKKEKRHSFSLDENQLIENVENFKDIVLNQISIKLEKDLDRVKEAVKAITEFRKGSDSLTFYDCSASDPLGARTYRKDLTAVKNDHFSMTYEPHRVAFSAINSCKEALESIKKQLSGNIEEKKLIDLLKKQIPNQYKAEAERVFKITQDAKSYFLGIINREHSKLEADPVDFGELAFAAASFGEITKWKDKELFRRVADKLSTLMSVKSSPRTNQPIYTDVNGKRVLPIGREMLRAFLQILQNAEMDIAPSIVEEVLGRFLEFKTIHKDETDKVNHEEGIGWNYRDAPHPTKPSVWVTGVSILALDRLVKMLNKKINRLALPFFNTTLPDQITDPRLEDMVYGDYELHQLNDGEGENEGGMMPASTVFQNLSVHLNRASGGNQRISSMVLYGPPGTGKTTFAAALAKTSGYPFIEISPTNILIEGFNRIENVARLTFEALSTLNRVVILFDEFETVLPERNTREADLNDVQSTLSLLTSSMLPKLIWLSKKSKRQYFAYFLATNHLGKIDPAAIREGRFDLRFGVYNPDPLSRKGTFIFRLLEEFTSSSVFKEFLDSSEAIKYFLKYTEGASAEKVFKIIKELKSEIKLISNSKQEMENFDILICLEAIKKRNGYTGHSANKNLGSLTENEKKEIDRLEKFERDKE